jgi:Family of unknown function (DUF6527)
MRRAEWLEPIFVEEIPRDLEPGTLYVSIAYRTAMHLCACGCGNEVVTPLHPARWSLNYDGEAVSLRPSVGNWALPCRSHYLVTRNQVKWAGIWSTERIDAGRLRDRAAVEAHFGWDGQETSDTNLAPRRTRFASLRRVLRL